jgi:hypothetical protein
MEGGTFKDALSRVNGRQHDHEKPRLLITANQNKDGMDYEE